MNGISLLLATQAKNPVSKPCCFCFLSNSQIHPLFRYYCLNLMLWFTAQIHIQDQGTHSLQLLGCHLVMAHRWIPSNQQFVSVKEAALLKITSSSQGSSHPMTTVWWSGTKVWPFFHNLEQLWTAVPVSKFPHGMSQVRICSNFIAVQFLPSLIPLTGAPKSHPK